MRPFESVPEPDVWFDRDGLQIAAVATYIDQKRQPLAVGSDDSIWSYTGGVWSRDRHAVRRHLSAVLVNKFKTGHVGNVEAFLKAQADPIEITAEPSLINCSDGMLRWSDGELLPHDPGYKSVIQLPVAYDPSAECPQFRKFLSEVVAPDDIDLIWEVTAYLLIAANPFHKALMLTGSGANGKSVLMNVWRDLLGAANVSSVGLQDLAGNRFAGADLLGKLANICGDLDGSYIGETGQFKKITGRDTVRAERKFCDGFDFEPFAVPVFSANKIPASADVTDGYLRRWLVLNFPNSFKGREDRALGDRLATELPGIFAEAVRRLPEVMTRGNFRATDSSSAAFAEFARRNDPVRYWFDTCVELVPEHEAAFIRRAEVYRLYQAFAWGDGVKVPVKSSDFHDRLSGYGARAGADHGGNKGYWHVKVLSESAYGTTR